LKCFFPGDSNAAVYQSEAFSLLIGMLAQNSQKYMAKQTDKAFIVEVKGITDVFQALYELNQWKAVILPSSQKSVALN
jgi:hypothetical protein